MLRYPSHWLPDFLSRLLRRLDSDDDEFEPAIIVSVGAHPYASGRAQEDKCICRAKLESKKHQVRIERFQIPWD